MDFHFMKLVKFPVSFLSLCFANLLFAGDGIDMSTRFQEALVPALPSSTGGIAFGQAGIHLIATGGDLGSTVHAWRPMDDQWMKIGQLGGAPSHAATASYGNALLVAAGEVDGVLSRRVIGITPANGTFQVQEFQEVPLSLSDAAACVDAGKLYLAGRDEGNKPAFLSLDLADPLADWRTLPAYNRPALLNPVLVQSFESLHVFGLHPDGNPAGFRYHHRTGWRGIAPPPFWSAGMASLGFGESHIFAFSAQSEAGPATAFAYHTLTDSWTVLENWMDGHTGKLFAARRGDNVFIVGQSKGAALTVLAPENNYGTVDHVVVIVYLSGMILVGLYFIRREKNTSDYFRGGRKVPWWAIGMSLFATGASAISLMTMPGKSYSGDWTYFAISIWSVACLPLSLYLLAPLVRKLNLSTANEYLELRFGVIARMVGSIIFIINQILARMAPIIFLPSIAMSAITGIDIWVWILLIGVVTTLYTFMGGLSAVIWTDTIQGFIMLTTVAGCLLLILFKIDMPPDQIWSTLTTNNKFHTFDWELDATYPTVVMMFMGIVFITLAGIGDQNYVQRVQAAPSLRDAKKAVATQMAVAVPINVLLFSLGTALYLYYKTHPAELNPVMKTDGIYPLFAAQHLPVGVSGLVIAALLAASMSTISSAICSVANVGLDDFYRRFKQTVSENEALLLGRILSVTVGILGILGALYLSKTDSKSVWDLALIITGLITNGIVGFFGLGLLTKRAHETGALIGILAGMCLVFWVQNYTPITFWLYNVVGSVITMVVGYTASLILPGKPNHLDGLTVYTLDKERPHL